MKPHIGLLPDGHFRLTIDGDLQFDTRDESIYHEALVLPTMLLADCVNRPVRVLVCGGGDGLALRECLRFDNVFEAHLVDYSPEIVSMARTTFAEVNIHAMSDSRVTVHIDDAFSYLRSIETLFDVILCDFTVPRSDAESVVWSREWFELVNSRLAPGGFIGINGLSPDSTPEAFSCLMRTVRAAGLLPTPIKMIIPSFREAGYGGWSFIYAGRCKITQRAIGELACPFPTQGIDLSRLYCGSRFSRIERTSWLSGSIHTIDKPTLVRLLLNPGLPSDLLASVECPSLDAIIAAIPITHPYHTRDMVEALAEHVAERSIQMDLRRLVDSALRLGRRLPERIIEELQRISEFVGSVGEFSDVLNRWARHVFAALVIVLTLANALAPDNAFAKGTGGLGHSSISRGYGGGFGGGRGSSASSRGSSSTGSTHVSGTGFRGSNFHSGHMVDVYGYSYRPRYYVYYGGYGHGHSYYHVGGGVRPTHPNTAAKHGALFVADDDLMVLDNGDVVITLSDDAYILVSGGSVMLMSNVLPDPIMPLFATPALIANVRQALTTQRAALLTAVEHRKDWLAWTAWSASFASLIADDRQEMENMRIAAGQLADALKQLPAANAATARGFAPGSVELFAGAALVPDGIVAILGPDNVFTYTDGRNMWREGDSDHRKPCPDVLIKVLKSVMTKLDREWAAEEKELVADMNSMMLEKSQLERDLTEYTNIEMMNPYDPNYDVDYGTESIPVGTAITRTRGEIALVEQDWRESQTSLEKQRESASRLKSSLQWFGK